MGREANVDSIRALEKQIEAGQGDVTKLKRVRNSLLNISTCVPPEILGYIFVWSIAREEDHSLSTDSHFDGIRKGSYNFLLVCHHWFEVASKTPELWSFWSNTLQVWSERCNRPGVAPVDLVLDEHENGPGSFVDECLRCALRDRGAQDKIRQIHLTGARADTLSAILSPLTPRGEDIRSASIESIDLQTGGSHVVDVSEFFARHSLPKLRSLFLHGLFRMPSWDHFVPQTTLLTTLSLDTGESSLSPPPTTSQLLSILAANPNLQELSIANAAVPEEDSDGSKSQVPLRHLKEVRLTGELRRVFGLLSRLALPETLGIMALNTLSPTAEDLSQIPGPFLREYFRRNHMLRDRLGINTRVTWDRILIYAVAVGEPHLWDEPGREPLPCVEFQVVLDNITPPDALSDLCIDIIASIPLDRVLGFRTNLPSHRMEGLLTAMPNMNALDLFDVELSKGFLQPNPDGPHANAKLLPSLQELHLDVTQNDGWGHLTTYLSHQTSGNQAISLGVSGRSPMSSAVAEEITRLVCWFGYQQKPDTESDDDEDDW
jgi:hypothetical protein